MPITAAEANQLKSRYGSIYSAYCRGRLSQDPAAAACIDELVAHMLGAHEVDEPTVPGLDDVCARVAALLCAPAVTVDGNALPPGMRLKIVTGPGIHFPALAVADDSGAETWAQVYVSEDGMAAWNRLVAALRGGKVPAEAPQAAPPAPAAPADAAEPAGGQS